jgi:2-polyprenyl-3-methyl-5-hydroxy-6-metoxy-1,4-benzoquinol methylase
MGPKADQHTEPEQRVAPSDTEAAERPRYDFEINMADDSTHTAVVRLVGSDRRVLELGPATGYMSKIFHERGCSVVGIEIDPDMARTASEHCERVIVGDIDTLDLEGELGDERFDVIVAADVLEHLKDPLGALRRLKRFLKPDAGYFVISVPNVAHGSVRLALLEGRFTYADLGLLDHTHLRFFTRSSLEQLCHDSGLAITAIDARELDLGASEVSFDQTAVPEQVLEALERDPDARTYQFVVEAIPVDPGGGPLAKRLSEQEAQVRRLEEQLAGVRRNQPEVDELQRAFASISEREGQLRANLVDAHDQVLRRDEQLMHVNDELASLQIDLERERERAQESEKLTQENQDLWRAQHEARALIEERDDEIRRLRVRVGRIVNSLPFRLWYRFGRLPVVRRVVARKVARFEADVNQTRPDGP